MIAGGVITHSDGAVCPAWTALGSKAMLAAPGETGRPYRIADSDAGTSMRAIGLDGMLKAIVFTSTTGRSMKARSRRALTDQVLAAATIPSASQSVGLIANFAPPPWRFAQVVRIVESKASQSEPVADGFESVAREGWHGSESRATTLTQLHNCGKP